MSGQELCAASSSGPVDPALYVSWHASALGRITETIEDRLLLEALGDVSGRRVLDVGCGDGRLAVLLRQRGAEVVGVDVNPAMIAVAAARAVSDAADVRLAVAAGERLPFADGTFDVVLAKTVLCFVGEAGGMIGEMSRVLRGGGRFVIGELGRWSFWAAQRRVRAWLGSALWRRGRFRTAGELRRLAGAAGLEVRDLRGGVFYPRMAGAARLMAPVDGWLGRRTTIGAAFLVLSADKRGSA